MKRWPVLACTLILALPAAADVPGGAPAAGAQPRELPAMHWADTASGRPFSKDPSVIRLRDAYLMYYSLPGPKDGPGGWSIGIARSANLVNWTKAGELKPGQEVDRKGLAAPDAWVHEGKVHLFLPGQQRPREDLVSLQGRGRRSGAPGGPRAPGASARSPVAAPQRSVVS